MNWLPSTRAAAAALMLPLCLLPARLFAQDQALKDAVKVLLSDAQRREATQTCESWRDAQALVAAAGVLVTGQAGLQALGSGISDHRQRLLAVVNKNCPARSGTLPDGSGHFIGGELRIPGLPGGGVSCTRCATAPARDAIAFLMLNDKAREELGKSMSAAKRTDITRWMKQNTPAVDELLKLHPKGDADDVKLRDFVDLLKTSDMPPDKLAAIFPSASSIPATARPTAVTP